VWRAPAGFIRAALCLHRHESLDWYRAWVDWTGAPSVYAGGLQFMQDTWVRAGGRGEPWQWSPREQVYRAWRIWGLNGGSFREWGTAGKCRLR
jgi:hypothetical protein